MKSKRMRVAFFVGPFPKLSKTFILDQITGLVDRGVDLDIYSVEPKQEFITHSDYYKYSLPSRIIYFKKNIPSFWDRFLKLLNIFPSSTMANRKSILNSLNFFKYGEQALSLNLFYEALSFLNKKGYDIVHAHFGPEGLEAQRFRDIGALKGKLVTSFHGHDLSTYIKTHGDQTYNHLFSHGNLFLPISNFWENKLKHMGCDSKKIKVHHMGINCNAFQFYPRSLDKKVVRILSVGRLVEKKGLEYSIQAVSSIVKTQKINITYNIIGDGPLKEKLQNMLYKFGAQSYIKLLGWKRQDEVIEEIKSSHIFLAPSVTASDGDMEGIPMVLMEAMSIGTPVISTQHSGIPELVKDGETGFLVPEKNVQAISKRLVQLIKHPDIWPSLINNSRQFVDTNFNIDKQNDKLLQHYEEILP